MNGLINSSLRGVVVCLNIDDAGESGLGPAAVPQAEEEPDAFEGLGEE